MRLIVTLFALAALTACGPELTNRQAEESERNSIIGEQKAELDSMVGNYEGYITGMNGKTRFAAKLILRSFGEIQSLTGRYEKVIIPNMVGFLYAGDVGDIVRGFNQGVYESDTGTLKMIGQTATTTSFNYLELRHNGDKLEGELFSGRLAQPVEFTRKRSK